MIAERDEEVVFRLRERILHKLDDGCECVIDLLLAHPRVIVRSAIASPKDEVRLRMFFDLIKDTLECMLGHITPSIRSKLAGQLSLLRQRVRLRLSAATVAPTAVDSRAFLIVQIKMCV